MWKRILLLTAVVVGAASCTTTPLFQLGNPHADVAFAEAAAQWEDVSPGMTKAEVTRVLGNPSLVRYGEFAELWAYNYKDGAQGTILFEQPGFSLLYKATEINRPKTPTPPQENE